MQSALIIPLRIFIFCSDPFFNVAEIIYQEQLQCSARRDHLVQNAEL